MCVLVGFNFIKVLKSVDDKGRRTIRKGGCLRDGKNVGEAKTVSRVVMAEGKG